MKPEKLLALSFLAIATLSFVFAIICFAIDTDKMYGTSHMPYEMYGGDAYTGIQHATASTSNNTYRVGENISNLAKCVTIIGGFIFIISGLTFASLGTIKLVALKPLTKNREKDNWEW